MGPRGALHAPGRAPLTSLFGRRPSPLDLNLLPPGRYRPNWVHKVAVGLVGLFTLALMAYLVLVTRESQQLRTRLAALDESLETGYVEQATALQAKRDELAQLQARAQEPGAQPTTAPASAENPWAALMAALTPADAGLQVASISVGGGQVGVIGVSQQREAIDAYLERLRSSALFSGFQPLAIEAPPDGSGGAAYQFTLKGSLIEGVQ